MVIYDGAYAANQDNLGAMTQLVEGFYQATSGAARMTHLVSNSNTQFRDKLTVNGSVPTGVSATNAFTGAQGSSWDNLTFNVNLAENASSITTPLKHWGSVDCLSWGAILFSAKVKDTDWDGLLNVWETGNTPPTYTCSTFNTRQNFGPPLLDPSNQQPLPDLHAMGANPCVQNIFVQVRDLKTTALTTYGNTLPPLTAPSHSHLPLKPVFDQVAGPIRNRRSA